MRSLFLLILPSIFLSLSATAGLAESCSQRAGACNGACTPELVSSGQQAGGTVPGCRSSCAQRLQACMKSGIWLHLGSRDRGLQEQVDRR
jgi:hypothetical protein